MKSTINRINAGNPIMHPKLSSVQPSTFSANRNSQNKKEEMV